MANKVVSFLETAGKDFEKGLAFAVKEAPVVTPLVNLIFPGVATVSTEVVDGINLVQNAIILVEQKYAAAGAQAGTGAQKAAEVITLVEPVITALLAKAGITIDTSYLQKIVNAVVAILNLPSMTPAAA